MLNVLFFILTVVFFVPRLSVAAEDTPVQNMGPSCPTQLQEAKIYGLVLTESRNVTESKLALAVRANQELNEINKQAHESIVKLNKAIDKLNLDIVKLKDKEEDGKEQGEKDTKDNDQHSDKTKKKK